MVKENGMIMMREEEYNKMEKQIKHLRKLLFTVMPKSKTEDRKVKCSEFLDVYNQAFEDLGAEECELYGNDVTVHWHGIYCNCGDGASAWNNIISNIPNVIEENGDED